MGFLNRMRRKEVVRERPVSPKPKKSKCKIRFKSKDNVEDIEFSPECTSQQIEMARMTITERRGGQNE